MAIVVRPTFLPQLTDSEAVSTRPEWVAEDAASTTRARVTALYVENGERIHRFLRDLLGDAALAADATQETFVRAYKKLPTLEADASARLAPWLFGIARNVSLELRKSRFRSARHFVPTNGHVPEGTAAAASPESEYLGREALRVVGAALAELPEERRAMLLLRLDHDLSYDDIALSMSCSLARVKVEIFRAREVLRNKMAEYEQS